jgi:hypothetical protein
MIFTGLAASAFLDMQNMAFSFANLKQQFVGGCTASMGHLGIDQLVHRTSDGTISAAHTEASIHIDEE